MMSDYDVVQHARLEHGSYTVFDCKFEDTAHPVRRHIGKPIIWVRSDKGMVELVHGKGCDTTIVQHDTWCVNTTVSGIRPCLGGTYLGVKVTMFVSTNHDTVQPTPMFIAVDVHTSKGNFEARFYSDGLWGTLGDQLDVTTRGT